MKIQRIDKSLERQILIGMIVSDEFLKGVRPMYSHKYMSGLGAVLIADWCFEYWDRYEKAPHKEIGNIYETKIRDEIDSSAGEFIEKLLEGLSDEWEHMEKFNAEYLLDRVEKFFKRQSLSQLSEAIKSHLASGQIVEAEALFHYYKPPARPSTTGLCPFTDQDAIERAFARRKKPLFYLPGALGQMMNSQLLRGTFVAFLAPEKRGKSWWLQYMALRAHWNRCNVVLFECGDMMEAERLCRIHSYISKQPYTNFGSGEDYLEIAIPIGFDLGTVVRHPKTKIKILDWYEAYRNGLRWQYQRKGSIFKLSVHENTSLNVQKMKAILDAWEHFEGFIPDVIIVDYPDIMAPEEKQNEERHKINSTWKALRALSQNRHCCIITATQSDANSYDRENITLKNFSEDKRKYAHVTAMYAINQTPREQEEDIIRIAELLIREGKFSQRTQVKVLQCLEIGRPYIDSIYADSREKENEKED